MDVCIAYPGDLSQPSGGTTRVIAFVSALSENGFKPGLVVPQPEGTLPDLPDADIIEVPVEVGGVANQLKRGYRITKKSHSIADDKDTILQFEHSSLASIGTFTGDHRYILDMHDLTHHSPLYTDRTGGLLIKHVLKKFENRALGQASDTITVSNSMAEYVRNELSSSADPEVVPNGYEEASIPRLDRTDTQPGRVVFLGTLHAKVDVEAIIRTARRDEVTELVLIGKGPLFEKLNRKAPDSVSFVGWMNPAEALELTATAELVISPYKPCRAIEVSSPVKIYTYAAMGNPIVATPGPDVIEYLHDRNGVVKSGTGGFPRRVAEVLRDDELQQSLSENAKSAIEGCSWENRKKSYINIVERVM